MCAYVCVCVCSDLSCRCVRSRLCAKEQSSERGVDLGQVHLRFQKLLQDLKSPTGGGHTPTSPHLHTQVICTEDTTLRYRNRCVCVCVRDGVRVLLWR